MERRYAICNSCSYSIFPIVPKNKQVTFVF